MGRDLGWRAGGTAVPGTAMSTVQEVKAEDITAETLMDTVRETFADVYPTRTIVAGHNYSADSLSASDPITNEDVKNAIEEALDWTTAYPSYDLQVEVDNVEGIKSSSLPTAKITITNNENSNDKSEITINFLVTIITSKEVGDAIGQIPLDSVQNALPAEADGEAVKNTINSLLSIILDGNDAYKTYVVNNKDFTLTADSVVLKAQEGTDLTYEVTFKLENLDPDAAEDVTNWTQDLNLSEVSEETDATRAKTLIVDQMDNSEFEVGANIDISAGSDATEIQSEVKESILNLLTLYGYSVDDGDSALGNKTFKALYVTGNNIYSEGKWTGTVQINDNGIPTTFTLNLNLVKQEAKIIENIEIINAKSELEVNAANKVVDTLDGVKITYSDGKTENVAAANMGTKGITWNEKDFNGGNLGAYTITLYAENGETRVSESFDVTVVRTIDIATKENVQNVFGQTVEFLPADVQSVTSSNTDVADVTLVKNSSGTVTNVKIKALKAGTTVLTVVEKDGTTWTKNFIVKADGTQEETADAAKANKAIRYIWNDADTLGFEATSYELTQLSEDGEETGVVTVEETTLDESPVFALTPGANGEATITFKGGDEGKLSVSYKLNVTDNAFTIGSRSNNYDEDALLLNDSATEKISEYKFNTDADFKVGDSRKIDVSDLGFDENDKIIFQSKDENVVDTLNASEFTSAQITREKNKRYVLSLKYGRNTECKVVLRVEQQMKAVTEENTIDKFGLIAVDGEIAVSDIQNVRPADAGRNLVNAVIKDDENGKSKLYVTPGEDVDNDEKEVIITVTDSLGNEAKVHVTVANNEVTAGSIEKFEGYEGYELAGADSNYIFDLGDEISFGDAVIKNAAGQTIALTSEMITVGNEAFSTQEATVNANNTVIRKFADLSGYGGMASKEDVFTVAVRPAYETLTASDLDIASGDSIASVAVGGDTGVTASVRDGSVRIQANKTSQNSTVNVTTKNGNVIAVEVQVDENGDITTNIVNDFRTSFTTIANNEETLGFVADTVETSDETVAIAKLAGDRITIHSVAPGTASIYAKHGEETTTIYVTVDAFGTVTVDRIVKATDNGFVRGDLIEEGTYAGQYNWYYYVDGETVKNNWVSVDENGTEVWYHFDKDGLMQRGWIKDETGWKLYYLDANGRMYHDTWANANENEALNMPEGMYYLQSDGSAQMNGWAKAPGNTEAWWYCAAGTGVFINVPENWAAKKLW